MFTQVAIKNNDIKVKSVKMIIRGDILKDNLYKMNISLRKPFVKAVKFKLPKTYIGTDQRYVLIDILKELNVKNGGNVEAAKVIGAEIAKRAKKAKINTVVFDRGGYLYHGRVKALAEEARNNGLEF